MTASVAALLLACMGSSHPLVFALSWALLSAPISLRGVRAAYFARHVPPEELSRVGQLASAAGLVGSVLGPLLAGLFHSLPGGGDVEPNPHPDPHPDPNPNPNPNPNPDPDTKPNPKPTQVGATWSNASSRCPPAPG